MPETVMILLIERAPRLRYLEVGGAASAALHQALEAAWHTRHGEGPDTRVSSRKLASGDLVLDAAGDKAGCDETDLAVAHHALPSPETPERSEPGPVPSTAAQVCAQEPATPSLVDPGGFCAACPVCAAS